MTKPVTEPLSYHEETRPDFAAQVAATFKITEDEDGIILTGPCPRCADVIEIRLFDEVVRGWLPWRPRGKPAAAGRRSEPMICTCDQDHPDRPAGGVGCGAYWNLVLVTEPEDGAAKA
jgi:hypothetical protein